jgi:HEAT repeat protein
MRSTLSAAALSLLLAAPARAAGPAPVSEELAAPAGSFGDPAAQLLDSDDDRRAQAARALGREGERTPRHLEPLGRALLGDLSAAVREAAAVSVAQYPGREPLRLLTELLRSERGEQIRAAAVTALAASAAHQADPEATLLVAQTLSEDPSPEVRRAAAKALGARGDTRGLRALRAAAKDPDASVRKAALAASTDLDRKLRYEAPKPKAAPKPDQSAAVKGRDACRGTDGWCECVNGPMKPRPRCVSRVDCSHLAENTYRPLGYTCTWDGQTP